MQDRRGENYAAMTVNERLVAAKIVRDSSVSGTSRGRTPPKGEYVDSLRTARGYDRLPAQADQKGEAEDVGALLDAELHAVDYSEMLQ